ncbi:MAG: AsmA family protein [Magnetococcus sp. YQC-3]
MAKLLKFILFFLLLALLGAGGLLLLLDPNAYKTEIAHFVETYTGRPLRIQGEIKLSLFPWVGLHLGSITLDNRPGFGPEPFATLTEAQLRVKWSPLLQRRLEMDTILLQGLHLNLEKNSQGVGNWEKPASPPEEPTANRQGTTATSDPSASATNLTAVTVAGVQILNARLSWRDTRKGHNQTLEILELTTGALQSGIPVPLTLRMRGGAGELTLTGNLELDWPKESLRLEGVQLATGELRIRGQLEGQQIFSAPRITGRVTVPPFSPRQLLPQWGIPIPESQDPAVWSKLEGEFPFVIDGQGVTLAEIDARLDESRLNGRLALHHFAQPEWRWDLTLDQLDLDRYRAPKGVTPEGEKPPTPPATATTAEKEEKKNPLEPLRGLDLQGRLRVERLRAARLHLQGVDLVVQGQGGVLRFTPVQAALYQGKLGMELAVDVRETLPRWRLDGRLEGVQAGPLWQDWQGHAPVTGLANVTAQLTTEGESLAAAKKRLNGTARFSLRDGQVKGVDLPRLLSDAYLVLQGEAVEGRDGEKSTAFSSLEGTLKIRDGVVENRDLLLVSPLLRIRGEGTVDLPADRVACRLNATVVEPLPGKGGRTVTELTGLTVPVQASGPVADLAWRLDLKTLLQQDAAKNAREKLENRIQDKASEFLKKRGLEKMLPADAGKRLLDALPFR